MSADRQPWILTATGRAFSLVDPKPEDVSIVDIAYSLSNQCRFVGHTKFFYPVGQHSVIVSDLVVEMGLPEFALHALLHDSPETYVGDMSSPLKSMLPEYKLIEKSVWHPIAIHFGLSPNEPRAVKHADLIALATERRDVMTDKGPMWTRDLPPPHGYAIREMSIIDVRRAFLRRFLELTTSMHATLLKADIDEAQAALLSMWGK